MKKSIAIALMVVFGSALGVAQGQIALTWDSTTFFLQAGGDSGQYPGDYLGADAFHALIWSPTAAPTENYALPGTGIGAGEIVLWSSAEAPRGLDDTKDDSARFNYAQAALVFSDADVGGDDINSGSVYSRIFSNSSVGAGDWYFQSLVNLGPGIPVYDPQNPLTVQTHTTSSASDVAIREMGVGDGMYQVIPEPSVFAMLGLGGLFLALRRRYVA